MQTVKNDFGTKLCFSFWCHNKFGNFRRATWEKNSILVEEHNRRADLGLHSYRLGMNQFADLVRLSFSYSLESDL